MELLSRLLGGSERVKVMRFFLHHEDQLFSSVEVAEKTKTKSVSLKKELAALTAMGFLERKRAKMVVSGEGKKKTSRVKEVNGYKLSEEFPHNEALKELLFDFQLVDKKELATRFKTLGRIKLFIVAGIFINDPKSRLDILVIGEAIKRPKAEKIFEGISAEVGRDVVYSIMDVEEYEYRIKMYDKFIRDVLEMPHEKVVDKITKEAK
jgi:hypothetical protein